MPNPGELTPGAVEIPDAELQEAIIFDDAAAVGQEVRCTAPDFDPLKATDRMPWMPFVTPGGLFYPKRGDRAVIGSPPDGPPVILWWQPRAAEPDAPF
jgi:hypothetical protein